MRKCLFAAALVASSLLVLFAGCSRYIDSENPVRTLPPLPPTPFSLSAKLDNGSATLAWEIQDSTVVKRFRIYLTDSAGQNTHVKDSTIGVSFVKTVTGLQANQRYFFQIAAVGLQGIEGGKSVPPLAVTSAIYSIAINNGALFTNTQTVNITPNVPTAVTHIMLSEDSTLSGVQFEPLQNPQSFRLSDGDGVKHVFARFLYNDGTQTDTPVSDSITLDTHAQIDSVFFAPANVSFTPGQSIVFGLNAGEPGGTATVSFAGSGDISLLDDGVSPDVTANDGIYTGRYIVPSDMAVTAGVVTGAFTDRAGNQAQKISARQKLTITNTPPTAVVLAVSNDTTTIRLTWSQNNDANFAMYRLYRSADTLAAVDTTANLLVIFNSQGTTNYDDTFGRNESAFAYRVFVFDKQGRFTGSNKVIAKK